jgi:class 3 adenylate cyclase
MPREFHYIWVFDLESSPEALWPLVSDTNRFNRDAGFPPMELLGIENRVRHVRFRIPFYVMDWDEEPFEWIYPYRFGILRRFHHGPLAEMRVDCRLERREPSGTRIVYETWAKPNGLLGYLAIPLGIGWISSRRFEGVYRRYDSLVRNGESTRATFKASGLSSAAQSRFKVQSDRLRAQGVDVRILQRLGAFLQQADDLSIQRMRPYALADGWDLPRRAVLEAFLRATRVGLLDMYWDILCPECRGVTDDFSSLKDLKGQTHCNTCQIDFSANFDHNVEVIFRPNPLVRDVDASVEFCVGSPQRQPHIIFSYIVPEGEDLPVDTLLEQGRYTLRATGLPGSQAITARKEGPAYLDVRAREFGWPAEMTEIGLTPKIRLINHTDRARTFELTRTAWSDQAATAADVTILQVFRDLFSSEVVRPGEQISVGAVCLMFTDLRDSTRLYRQIGDAPAFGRVREHFDILEKAVAEQGGSVVKTMGDSVMAAFKNPVDALKAIWDANQRMAADGEPGLWLKAGIHRGPCIVVNLNERLDYFGSTVNIAARLPGFSDGNEAILSEGIRNDLEAQEFLEKNLLPNSLSRFQAQLRGYDEPLPLWKMKM